MTKSNGKERPKAPRGSKKQINPDTGRLKHHAHRVSDRSKIMSPREARFVVEYIKDPTSLAACARRAGYSESAAKQASVTIMERPVVKEAIKAHVSKTLTGLNVTAERVLGEIASIAFANIERYITVGSDGQPQLDLTLAIHEPRSMAAVSEVSSEVEMVGSGEEAFPVRKAKIKLYNKLDALDKLARHLNLLKADTGEEGNHTHVTFQIINAPQGRGIDLAATNAAPLLEHNPNG